MPSSLSHLVNSCHVNGVFPHQHYTMLVDDFTIQWLCLQKSELTSLHSYNARFFICWNIICLFDASALHPHGRATYLLHWTYTSNVLDYFGHFSYHISNALIFCVTNSTFLPTIHFFLIDIFIQLERRTSGSFSKAWVVMHDSHPPRWPGPWPTKW